MSAPVDILAAPQSAAPASRRSRLLDPLAISIFLALVFTAAGLVELLLRGPVPAGYRDDGAALIALTIACGLSLGLLWWSPLAGLAVSTVLLTSQAIAGYEYTTAAVLTVVVASLTFALSAVRASR